MGEYTIPVMTRLNETQRDRLTELAELDPPVGTSAALRRALDLVTTGEITSVQRQRCSTTQLDEQTAQTLIDKLDALSEDIREHSHQIRAIGNIHNQIARALHEQRRSGRSMGVSDDVIRSMTRSSDELIHREQSYTARVAAVHHEVSRCLR